MEVMQPDSRHRIYPYHKISVARFSHVKSPYNGVAYVIFAIGCVFSISMLLGS